MDRLETKLDTLSESIHQNHLETVTRLTRLETQIEQFAELPERVRALEGVRGYITGIAAAISFVLTSGMLLFTSLFHRR